MEKYHDNYGHGISQGKAMGQHTYVKTISQGSLHVHAPGGTVTGATLNGTRISNYEAAMLDLQDGPVHKGNW